MLESIKENIIEIALRAQREGLCKHKSGNFSVRDAKSGLIVITPAGIDREVLTSADMVVSDIDARVVEHLSGTRPSSELLMHLAVYKARPEINAIAHTHSKYATVFAVLNKPVPPFVYETMVLQCENNTIPVAPYARPGTVALAENVAKTLKQNNAALMQSHGAIACHEESLEGAYLIACYIEELCEIYHHILSANGGKEPDVLPVNELQRWAYPSEITFPDG